MLNEPLINSFPLEYQGKKVEPNEAQDYIISEIETALLLKKK